jgi:tRNA dimethylallyltransferase
LAEYQALAYDVINELHARASLPVLVGGTVLYVRAVVEGLCIPEVPPDPALRDELELLLAEEGREALFTLLQRKDPATAAVIDANNPRRLIRALEITITTGRSKTELEGADPPPYAILKIGLRRSRENLHERIDRRVDEMMRQGLVEETRALLDAGYAATLPAMTSLGYREITAYLRGELTLEEAVYQIKVETHRYLRHQTTWLRKMDGIHWVDMESGSGPAEVMRLVADFWGLQ